MYDQINPMLSRLRPLFLRLVYTALLCACLAPAGAADRAHTLNVYAWSEYFPPALIAQFEAQTGIHVNNTVLDSPEAAETILSAGSSNYDLVTMNAAPELGREIPKGFWKVLDRSRIPNSRNADPKIMELLSAVDPGNQHAIPWMWGTTGIIYNVDRIEAVMPGAPTSSLDMIFKKEMAARFAACGIGLIDSWGDIMPMVAHYLGQPALSDEPAKLAAVSAKLREIRPYIRRVSTSGYYQQLAEGDLCLAIGYSGDALIARRMVEERTAGSKSITHSRGRWFRSTSTAWSFRPIPPMPTEPWRSSTSSCVPRSRHRSPASSDSPRRTPRRCRCWRRACATTP
jgi:putrescine transport system substrate-binding protein